MTTQPTQPAPAGRVHCAHGYVLMQDSCPICDTMAETPHNADQVTVWSPWAGRLVQRCRQCGSSPIRRIHRARR